LFDEGLLLERLVWVLKAEHWMLQDRNLKEKTGFGLYFKITGVCSVLLCLRLEQPLSGSEEGGSQVMQNTENFVFCLSTVGCRAREHIAMT
jgi:hypothetical protein